MPNQRAPSPLGGAAPKPRRKQVPFPGLIDGHRWSVREGRWPVFIDRSDMEAGGVMSVPLDDTPIARKLRLHEQAHITWTDNVDPDSFDGVTGATVEACEDARIIQKMNDMDDGWRHTNEGFNAMPDSVARRCGSIFQRIAEKLVGNEEDPSEPKFGEDVKLIDGARLTAMSRGYCEGITIDNYARNAGLDWIKEEVENLHRQYIGHDLGRDPTLEDSVAYARALEDRFRELEQQLGEQAQAFKDADMQSYPGLIDEDDDWGRLTVEEAPLTERLKANPERKVRATDMGAIPRYMHRITIDQRVFGRRRKRVIFQGTVLIDHSGSMSLSTEQVEEILTRWPAVTIATYSGQGGSGKLRVIARNGKRAANQYLRRPSGGENVVDGPALDWLAKQKGPRVWISDGHVTGVGEKITPGLRLDAARKVSRGRITRIEDVQSLLGS